MDIKSTVISSVKILAIGRFAGQAVSWAVTILVLRLLSPDDYGLMALGMTVISICEIFKEIGIGSAIIKEKNITSIAIKRIFGFLIVFNSFIYSVLFISAPLIGDFFKDIRVVDVVRLVALQFPLSPFVIIPSSLLSREMAFKKRSLGNFFKLCFASTTTLVMAQLGFGVYSLVTGSLIGVIAEATVLNILIRRMYWPEISINSFRTIWPYLKFGGAVTVSRIFWILFIKSDVFIVGRILGNNLLGIYSVAIELATMPMQKVSGVLNEVAYSGFSKLKNRDVHLNSSYCNSVRLLSSFAFPIFWGISSLGPEIVKVFLGPKWEPVSWPLVIISLIVPLQMLNNVNMPALMSIERVGVGIWNTIIACLLMPISFYIGSLHGILGVALAWLFVYPLNFALCQHRVLKVFGIEWKMYLANVAPPLYYSLVMYLSVWMVKLFIYWMSPPLVIVILTLLGVILYVSLLCFFNRTLLVDIRKTVGI